METHAPRADNRPPSDVNPLGERLAEQYDELVSRTNELAQAAQRIPQRIDDSNIDVASGFVRQLREHTKLLEATRENEKKDYLAAGRTVDGFFKIQADRLAKIAADVEKLIRTHLQAKADAERKVREAELERQRQEAARIAEEQRQAEAELERLRLEEEEQQRAAAEAAKLAEQPAPDPAIELERQRSADAAIAAAIEAEARSREQAAIVREAEKAATAKTADLARTRSAIAGTSTLATTLDFKILNHRQAVMAVAEFVDAEALVRAVRTFTRTYKGADINDRLVKSQPLGGVEFYLAQKARVV